MIPRTLLCDANLSSTERNLYCWLAIDDHSGRSPEEIAGDLGVSPRTIRRSLNHLEVCGWIDWNRYEHQYTIHAERQAEADIINQIEELIHEGELGRSGTIAAIRDLVNGLDNFVQCPNTVGVVGDSITNKDLEPPPPTAALDKNVQPPATATEAYLLQCGFSATFAGEARNWPLDWTRDQIANRMERRQPHGVIVNAARRAWQIRAEIIQSDIDEPQRLEEEAARDHAATIAPAGATADDIEYLIACLMDGYSTDEALTVIESRIIRRRIEEKRT